MRFRPRYSLLTLLIVTALIAVGVKLWYGPHHVVERSSPHNEAEYTYTRDWLGTKVINGPYVRRTYDFDGSLHHINVFYFRSGFQVSWKYRLIFHETFLDFSPVKSPLSPLSPEEDKEFRNVVDRERQRRQDAGIKREEYEG